MKKVEKSAVAIRNFDELISKFSENEILNTEELSSIHGGEGNGSEPILIPPKF